MAKEDSVKKLKEKYELIRKKYSLPKFEDLDKEFDINGCNESGNLLREILANICERLNNISHFFDPVLDINPSSIHSFIELEAFDKTERSNLFKLFKRLSYSAHNALLSDISGEKESADFINSFWKEWPKLKSEIKKYMEKITDSWANDAKTSDKIEEYFG